MTGIYMYENKYNHKKYIGQAVDIAKRKWSHIHDPSASSIIDKLLQEYGEAAFTFTIIEKCSADYLDEREIYWIDYYHSWVQDPKCWGYNILRGGKDMRGECNPGRKLTNNDVYQIIKLLEEGILNNTQIAQQFNVIPNTINLINNCHSWTHLHNYTTNIRDTNLKDKNVKYNSINGERNPLSKLTEQQALEIIDLLEHTTIPMAQIARQYHVGVDTVADINRIKTWKHLHNHKTKIRENSNYTNRKKVI